jgi:hypothetical protein
MAKIKVSVEYYDAVQRSLFQGFPNSLQLNNLVRNEAEISKDELLAYMMFTEQMDRNGFRTYNDLCLRISSRLGDIDDFLSFNNDSVQARMIGNDMMQVGFTERIGVALGLCVVNKIHSLTAADWKKIPTAPGRYGHPTFDFEIAIASTGNSFIQAENKGSTVANNASQSDSIQKHYASIKTKKEYVRIEENIRHVPIHQNLYYGTIGVLDEQPNSRAKVWLVDPPAFEIDMSPEKYKLLARLHYYLDEFRNIGVKEKITEALEARIKLIEESDNYSEFDNNPLNDGFAKRGGNYLYMDGKMLATVDTNEAFGKVFFTKFKQDAIAYLMAFPKALMRLIVKQDFEAILAYTYNPDFINENVQVLIRLKDKDTKTFEIPRNLKFVLSERNKYYEATYFGKVNHSIDGRIFGLLNVEQKLGSIESSKL